MFHVKHIEGIKMREKLHSLKYILLNKIDNEKDNTRIVKLSMTCLRIDRLLESLDELEKIGIKYEIEKE